MNSDEDYSPPRKSPDALRRSKRITRSDKKIFTSKGAKKTEKKFAKKPSGKTKSTPGKKPRLSQSPKKEESSESFNGSCLTPEELRQLFIKFTQDGHFRLNRPKASPPPLVISRTTDGKFVTTKIECYKTKKQLIRDLATTLTSQRTEAEVTGEMSDPTSVTFSTPLTQNPSGSSIPTRTSPGQFIPQRDKNFELNRTNNRAQGTPNALPRLPNFGAENGFLDKSVSSNLHPATSSATGNSQGNGFRMSSGSSAFFINSARQTLPARPNPINPSFMGPASSTWIPAGQSTLENRNDSNTCGIYSPSNNMLYSNTAANNQANRFDREGSKDDSHGNLDPRYLLNRYDNHSNFDAAGIYGAPYQQRETNAQNSSSNAFGVNTSTILSNAVAVMPEKTIKYGPPRIITYNSDIRSVNNSVYGAPPNSNSLMTDSNGYQASFMAWNNVQLFPNSYISPADSPYYNNGSGRSDTGTKLMIGDQGSTISQVDFWSSNNQSNKDFFAINGNGTSNSSPMASNDLSNNTTTIDSNVPGTMTDSEIGLSQSSSEQTEKPAFNLDSQDNGLCPTVSSSCSFDDEISYDKYMGGNVLYVNDNSQPWTQGNDFPLRLPSVTSIKTEMRSWYDGNNCQYRNDQSTGAEDAADYDFKA